LAAFAGVATTAVGTTLRATLAFAGALAGAGAAACALAGALAVVFAGAATALRGVAATATALAGAFAFADFAMNVSPIWGPNQFELTTGCPGLRILLTSKCE
jgi:hypothetical protein